MISRNGVAPDPSKTDNLLPGQPPTTRNNVQQFLGIANYYRKFIRNCADTAKPLHLLTEKNAPFKWTAECQTAFLQLQKQLIAAPVLTNPDFNCLFILDTGIGAVLSQRAKDGHERVIAYGSWVFTKEERKYCATRRELLAVVTFTQHFCQYLVGQQFIPCTDHGSLTWLRNFRIHKGN